jgi:hypothetical protein
VVYLFDEGKSVCSWKGFHVYKYFPVDFSFKEKSYDERKICFVEIDLISNKHFNINASRSALSAKKEESLNASIKEVIQINLLSVFKSWASGRYGLLNWIYINQVDAIPHSFHWLTQADGDELLWKQIQYPVTDWNGIHGANRFLFREKPVSAFVDVKTFKGYGAKGEASLFSVIKPSKIVCYADRDMQVIPIFEEEKALVNRRRFFGIPVEYPKVWKQLVGQRYDVKYHVDILANTDHVLFNYLEEESWTQINKYFSEKPILSDRLQKFILSSKSYSAALLLYAARGDYYYYSIIISIVLSAAPESNKPAC